MNILIAGGTGFIGTALTEKLIAQNNHIFIVTRDPNKHMNKEQVTYVSYDVRPTDLPKIDAVINLAGESLFGRWTNKKKKRILSSRINSTKLIVDLMKRMNQKPNVFINASAVGFYGMNDKVIFTEHTTQADTDFLAYVTSKWEQTAKRAEKLNIRTVYTRFGIVLDQNAGALSMMKLPFQLFAGGKVASGNQWMSWIDLEDCINMLLFAIENNNIIGPLNITAPYPKRNKDFTKILASILIRPTLFSVPESLVNLALGEMSSLVTKGQFAYPQKALQHNFTFNYPHLNDALKKHFKK